MTKLIHALFWSPPAPAYPSKHPPHVLAVEAHGPLFRVLQSGAAEQSTRFSTVLAMAKVCFSAVASPALLNSWDEIAAVAAAVSAGFTVTVLLAVVDALRASNTRTTQEIAPPGSDEFADDAFDLLCTIITAFADADVDVPGTVKPN